MWVEGEEGIKQKRQLKCSFAYSRICENKNELHPKCGTKIKCWTNIQSGELTQKVGE